MLTMSVIRPRRLRLVADAEDDGVDDRADAEQEQAQAGAVGGVVQHR